MARGIPTTEELRALGLEGAVDSLQVQNAALRAEVEAQHEAMGHASNALEQKEREIGLLRAEVGRLWNGLDDYIEGRISTGMARALLAKPEVEGSSQ